MYGVMSLPGGISIRRRVVYHHYALSSPPLLLPLQNLIVGYLLSPAMDEALPMNNIIFILLKGKKSGFAKFLFPFSIPYVPSIQSVLRMPCFFGSKAAGRGILGGGPFHCLWSNRRSVWISGRRDYSNDTSRDRHHGRLTLSIHITVMKTFQQRLLTTLLLFGRHE
jgi:hypothetical protein